MANNFGLRLEKLADHYGYDKKEVSKLLGFSDNTFGLYVKEERSPHYKTLIKLADLFHVSLDYLLLGREFDEDDKRTSEMARLNELITIFKKAECDSPYILELEKWELLEREDLLELTNHFEWVVEKAKRRK